MLKAFVTLAKCLNITQSAQLLSVTRQTIRRHIDEFERLREEPLFLLDNRQYQLTDLGRASLEEAEDIVSRAEALSGHNNGHVYARNIDGLETLTFTDEEGKIHRSQQHSISSLWTTGYHFYNNCSKHGGAPKPSWNTLLFRQSDHSWWCIENPKKGGSVWRSETNPHIQDGLDGLGQKVPLGSCPRKMPQEPI